MPPGLADHLRRGAAEPFAWGELDCCLWACDWVLVRRGVDPMAGWRGRYRTRLGAARRIARAGGFLSAVRAEMAAAGLVPTFDPVPGDVAAVLTPQGEALAIRTPTGWAGKGPQGLAVCSSWTPLAAWSV